jgi:hypothetical protein
MPSPSGIFIGQSLATLQAIQAAIVSQITTGVYTSTNGAGKGGSKVYPVQNFQEATAALKEVNYALQKLQGTLPTRQTNFVVGGCANHPGTYPNLSNDY